MVLCSVLIATKRAPCTNIETLPLKPLYYAGRLRSQQEVKSRNHDSYALMVYLIPRRSSSAAASAAVTAAGFLLCWTVAFSSRVVPCGTWQIASPRVGRSGATTANRRHSSTSTNSAGADRHRVVAEGGAGGAGHRQAFSMSTAAGATASPLDGVGEIRRVDTQESQAALVSK